MPFEIMDQRGLSASSHIYDDIFRSESNGLWQPKNTRDNLGTAGINEMGASPGSILNTCSHSEQIDLQLRQINPPRELAERQLLSREDGFGNTVKFPNKSLTQHLKQQSNTIIHPISAPYSLGGMKIVTDAGSHESSLFSSSLSEIFTCKMRLSGNDVLSHQPACKMVSNDVEESYGCHRKVESGHIGNILPDEDDLFSGVSDDLGCNADANISTDFEDFDLFSSGGGLELEEDNLFGSEKRNSNFGGISCLGGISGKQQLGKYPSRTLFVRNISNNIEDSELTALFKKFGDIRTLYTACKHRGFVMISYYDLRAAQNAMRTLQNKPLHHRNLDIHFSIPKDNSPEKDINHGMLILSDLDPSVSNDKLQNIFGFYGEIKDIFEIHEKHQAKLIEFYDVRAADSALRELNGSQVAGKQIKLEPACPGDAICQMQHSQKGRDGHNIHNNFPSLHHATSSRENTLAHVEMGSSPGLYPSIRQNMNAFPVNSLPNGNRNSILVNAFPTPVGSPSTGKLFGKSETNSFLGTKAASGPRFHPHSFPEFCDALGHDASYNSSIMDISSNISSGLAEGIDGRCIPDLSSSGNLMEFTGGFESSENGNYTPRGLHHMWNKSNMPQQHPSSHMMWQNSPPFVNGSCTPRLKMSGFPRMPHHMLRMPNVDHHVGSAPVVNGSTWDIRHSNLRESPEASSFHLSSLGSAGFPGTWQLYPAEVSAQNVFPHVGGNTVDMMANAGQLSSKHVSCIFPGRNPVISITRHDAANERSRNQHHRRSDSNSANADKKQFELDIDCILRGEDKRTTLMIKNIPNKYTSKMLLAAIDEQCRGTYDFIYLPIDFKNKCNVGYAFINMIDPSQIVPFYQAFNGKKWEKFNSEKVASLAYARIQGKAALIAHFQNSSLMNEDKRCRPILFHTDGPNAGDPEPFPMGTNSRARPGKFRSCSNEEYHHQGNPSAPASGDESTNGTDPSLASSKISD